MALLNSGKYSKLKEKYKIHTGFIFVFILTLIFIFSFYGKILINPNGYLFCSGGDGIKNYYTYGYYIANNKSNLNFEGYNYPYGDHILYTDNHPIVAFSMRYISKIFPCIKDYSIGIINFLMIISLLICSLLIYLILIELKVKTLLAVLSSIAISVLSPQILRLTCHLALSYSFCIPLTWYLLIKYEKKESKLKYSIFLFINNSIWFFVHAYLGIIAASFIFTYLIIKFLLEYKTITKKIRYFLFLFIQVVAPILLFRLFLLFTDNHTGRTNNPYGFFEYNAGVESIFIPTIGPLRSIWNYLIPNIQQNYEGWAYIGFVSELMILLYFIVSIIKIIKNKSLKYKEKYLSNKHLKIALICSIVFFLFSMGYPFNFTYDSFSMKGLLNYFSILKQFRGTGRFAWIFFFIINIFSIFIINYIINYLYTHKKKIIAYLIILTTTGFIFAEGLPYHQAISKEITITPNLFDFKQLDETTRKAINSINIKKYQAIIPLPYYSNGSENYGKLATDKIYKLSDIISFHTGLPILSSYMTRTSIWESKNIIQVISPSYYKKDIIKDLPSDKPFLIIFSNEYLTPTEEVLLNRGTLLYDCKEFKLLEISKEKLFTNDAVKEINQFEQKKSSLQFKNGFLTNNPDGIIYYDNYEYFHSDISFRGNGAFYGFKKSFYILVDFTGCNLQKETEYIASFWMHNNGDNFGQDKLGALLVIQENYDNIQEWPVVYSPAQSCTIFGDWSLVEMKFTIKDPSHMIYLVIKGEDYSDDIMHIDDMLVYKSGTEIYRIEKEKDGKIQTLFKNNQEIKIPDL